MVIPIEKRIIFLSLRLKETDFKSGDDWLHTKENIAGNEPVATKVYTTCEMAFGTKTKK